MLRESLTVLCGLAYSRAVFRPFSRILIWDAPDIWPIKKSDIRLNTWLDNYIFGKISNKFMKTALTVTIDFCKHQIKHDIVAM
jgi:hypothetical protein